MEFSWLSLSSFELLLSVFRFLIDREPSKVLCCILLPYCHALDSQLEENLPFIMPTHSFPQCFPATLFAFASQDFKFLVSSAKGLLAWLSLFREFHSDLSVGLYCPAMVAALFILSLLSIRRGLL